MSRMKREVMPPSFVAGYLKVRSESGLSSREVSRLALGLSHWLEDGPDAEMFVMSPHEAWAHMDDFIDAAAKWRQNAPLHKCTSCDYEGEDVCKVGREEDQYLCETCGDANPDLFLCDGCREWHTQDWHSGHDNPDLCVDCYSGLEDHREER